MYELLKLPAGQLNVLQSTSADDAGRAIRQVTQMTRTNLRSEMTFMD
jgi:hypothetical protein